MGTAIICLVVLILIVFAVKSCCRRLTKGCCALKGTAAPMEAEDQNTAHYPFCRRLYVEGMTCANCAQRIQNAFHARPDCLCTVSLQEQTVCVRMKIQQEDQELRKIIEKLGYRVRGIDNG